MITGRPPRMTEENRERMVILFKDHLTIRNLAKHFSCSTWVIRNELKRAGVLFRYCCQICKKPLYGNRRVKYCSKYCQRIGMRKYRNCQICDAPLLPKGPHDMNVKYCNECSSNLTSQTACDIREKRKAKLINIKGGKCEICGYSKCMNALEFHHRDRTTKLFSIAGGNIISRKWHIILHEIDKCDLLCSNCHREKEYLRFQKTRKYICK